MSEDLYNASFRLFAVSAKLRQLNDNLVSGDSPHRMLDRDKHILRKARIVRHNKPIRFARLISAYDLRLSVCKHGSDLSLFALSRGARRDAHLHRIVVDRSAAVILSDKNILILTFDAHKSKASGIAFKHARHGACLCLCVFSFFRYLDLALCDKRIEHLL